MTDLYSSGTLLEMQRTKRPCLPSYFKQQTLMSAATDAGDAAMQLYVVLGHRCNTSALCWLLLC